MQKLSSIEIKDKFLSFFKEKDHMEITDSSIIPKNDPTLLFINSGMAPIKNYFTGVEKPPYPRLCDIQPCIRTIDIDSIGDKHHLTSFQMLGSWSINNYFKEKAIALAFEFLTERLNIPQEKLYVTVFSGDEELGIPCDDEAYECWRRVGMPESHIVKCGKEDNFWGPTAETGPCGPCTEIFFDTGEGKEYVPGGEFDTSQRYIEIWNAGVFMQFNKNADGSFSKLSFTSVDTGAGLERLAMVLSGYKSVYETDLLAPIKSKIESLLDKNKIPERDKLIMTDHLRTVCLILSEKVAPSNEGRGYIPRKLMRRCMMITGKFGIKNFDFSAVIEFILETYKNIFAKFSTNKAYIVEEFCKEYNQFKKVLTGGLERLSTIKNETNKISAEDAFDLVTTYGLPIDMIKVYAEENNMELDESGFNAKLEEHKSKSRNTGKTSGKAAIKNLSKILSKCRATKFFGYNSSRCEAEIVKIIKNEKEYETAQEGENAILVLSDSVFYAESGGQCADTGVIKAENAEFEVTDVQKTSEGIFIHFGKVISGNLAVNNQVECTIDYERRLKISNNHTSVHLLQSALQQLYGKNVHQAGSKVEPDKLRFDFNYDCAITEDEIGKLEQIVNNNIRKNIPRQTKIMNIQDAIQSGAMALFESKYGENVRVVSFGDISSELCGGIHTEKTGNIGSFLIIGTESVGKGIKRITAITGNDAVEYVRKNINILSKIAKLLKVNPEMVFEKIQKDISEKPQKKEESKPISENDIKPLKSKNISDCGYIEVLEGGKKTASEIGKLSDKLGKILVGIVGADKKQVIIAVSDKQVEKVQANEILKKLTSKINCKGGGNKKVATCGTNAKTGDIVSEISKIL